MRMSEESSSHAKYAKTLSGGLQLTKGRQRMYARHPWQKLAVDLVGPMPETQAENKWILVITDHCTRWQKAIPVLDATAPVVAATLDQRVFCYIGFLKQPHSDQGIQSESQLMEELCTLWRVDKTHTTHYHPWKLTTDLAAETGSRRVGLAASQDYKGLSRDAPFGHGRNSQLYDVGPGAEVTRPVAVAPPSGRGDTPERLLQRSSRMV